MHQAERNNGEGIKTIKHHHIVTSSSSTSLSLSAVSAVLVLLFVFSCSKNLRNDSASLLSSASTNSHRIVKLNFHHADFPYHTRWQTRDIPVARHGESPQLQKSATWHTALRLFPNCIRTSLLQTCHILFQTVLTCRVTSPPWLLTTTTTIPQQQQQLLLLLLLVLLAPVALWVKKCRQGRKVRFSNWHCKFPTEFWQTVVNLHQRKSECLEF